MTEKAQAPLEDFVPESGLLWYVYDNRANLLRIAGSLAEAESWAVRCWGVETLDEREQVQGPDFWYPAMRGGTTKRYGESEYRARIVRSDRVREVGRDAGVIPRYL